VLTFDVAFYIISQLLKLQFTFCEIGEQNQAGTAMVKPVILLRQLVIKNQYTTVGIVSTL
jgi:hypothetical protein